VGFCFSTLPLAGELLTPDNGGGEDNDMTPEEFKKNMAEISAIAENNEEAAHRGADFLICLLLREIGYGDGVDIFRDMPKRY